MNEEYGKLDRRHRWKQVREYKIRVTYRCSVCRRWGHRTKLDALCEATLKARMPMIKRVLFSSNPFLARLVSGQP